MAKTKKYNPGDDPSIRNLRSAFGRQVKSEAASHPAYGFGTSGRDESQKARFALWLVALLCLNYDAVARNCVRPAKQRRRARDSRVAGAGMCVCMAVALSTGRSLPAQQAGGHSQQGLRRLQVHARPAAGARQSTARCGAPGCMCLMCATRHAAPDLAAPAGLSRLFFSVPAITAAQLYLSKEQAKTMSGSYSQGAVYKSYGALGKQVDSAYPSAPTLSFGTSARSIKYGNDKQPGPGAYNQEGGLGRMVDSKRPTSPRSVFGTSTRDDAAKVHLDDELMKTYYGRGTPGPVYRVEGGVGRQTLSTRKTQPTVSFSTSTRLTYDNRDVPGAGAYNQGVALGRQVVSSRKTLPTAKIGSSTRDGAMKVFISKEHEKGTYGTGTPGPITANPYTAMGRQLLSRRPTSPGWGFGTSRVSSMVPSVHVMRSVSCPACCVVSSAAPALPPAPRRPPRPPPPLLLTRARRYSRHLPSNHHTYHPHYRGSTTAATTRLAPARTTHEQRHWGRFDARATRASAILKGEGGYSY